MADTNIEEVRTPVRSDDQILPFNRWVSIGKSNCFLRVDKPSDPPILKLAIDILRNTSFFRAFTASSTIPSIYIQQFWNAIRFNSNTNTYSCQLDEQWVDITKETLGSALQILPTGDNIVYTPPPNQDKLIKFINELGYPSKVSIISSISTYEMYQPWRALLTLINLCLTGKTSGYERP